MKSTTWKSAWQSIALGIVAGMRSASAPAIAAHILSTSKPKQLLKTPLAFMRSEGGATLLKVMAAGELIADKLPFAGDRIQPIGLVARGVSGAISGGSISKGNGDKLVNGTLLGTAAAIGSSFAFFYLRKYVVNKTKIDDPIIGSIEDALVIGIAVVLVRPLK